MLKSCPYQKWRPQRLLAFVLVLGIISVVERQRGGYCHVSDITERCLP